MKLVPETDPILRQQMPRWEWNADPAPFDIIEFAKELVEYMYDLNGIGIAANQVGIPYRIFAMRGHPENFVCINPRIVMPGEQHVVLEEGCLTYPGLYVKIKRPQHIRVRFDTPNGETRTETFTGMSARIFQHELDHLDGVIFYNRANRYHRDKAFKALEVFHRNRSNRVISGRVQ